ncbi:MAG: LTA synthase family protein [Chloroflexota bacterium]|nr:LTA synthase family protein [Chloroflexota bacterium]
MRRPRLDWTALPVHPLLAAAYPVIFLFAVNAAEQVTLEPLWLPLLLAVGGAAAVLVVFAAILRDWLRAALLTTVAVIGFFGYGHAWNAASEVIDSQWPLIGAWAVALLVAFFLAWRAGRWTVPATRALNVVAALAILLNVWSVAGTMVAFGAVDATDRELTSLELAPPDPDDLPDVYYIILDRYAGSTALRQTYDFDNEPFLTALEERGFEVARQAHSNYIKTPLSLASSLNMEFLDTDALKAEATEGKDREPIHRALRNHLAVPTALEELGYQYIHVGNWWTPSATNVDADRVFRYEGQDEFSTVLSQTTLLRAFNEPAAAPDDPWDWRVLRQHTLYALDKLDEIADTPGPKYVFAHVLLPHDPYVFNVDGSFTGREQVAELGQKESYRRQLSYGNARMLQLIDRIQANSPDAVIMLQADEGPFPARYRADEWGFKWRDATDAELEEKFGILFAMHVPGADLRAEGLHDAITPVNAFRIIFNARFGTDLPLLPDRTWAHTDLWHFYDFFEITDRLHRG